MNVTKRSKKPSFLKVFERNDEKEDNPLLHASSASLFSSAASTDLDLPPLFNSSLLSTAEEAAEGDDDDNEECEDNFVVSTYDSDDEISTPNKNQPVDRRTNGVQVLHSVENDVGGVVNKSASYNKREDEPPVERSTHNVRASEHCVTDSKMDSQIFSEHSESLNDEIDDNMPSPKAAMVVDNSVRVPDTLVRHAKASAAATSKQKERRSHRLLSGAKGLLRVGLKGPTSPKAPKVELEAAVRKVSAGESAKSFAQFSLEEVVPGRKAASIPGPELLVDSDGLGDHDSDDDSDEHNKSLRVDLTSSQESPALTSPEVIVTETVIPGENCIEGFNSSADRTIETSRSQTSPRRSSERRAKSSSEEADRDADRRTRRRAQASKSLRQSSVKEPSLGINARRERQRSVRSADTSSSKESGESHSRRRTLHRLKESQEDKIDEKVDHREFQTSHHHKSSRSDRKKSELKPRKERCDRPEELDHGTRASKDGSGKTMGHQRVEHVGTSAKDLGQSSSFEATPILPSQSPRVGPMKGSTVPLGGIEAHLQDPSTPQAAQGSRLNDLIKRDRACKTTDSPTKRRSFAKSFSDRFLSASISPSVETLSSTAAVTKHHRKVSTTDDLERSTLSSINLASVDQEMLKRGVDNIKSKKMTHEESTERDDRSPQRKSKPEAGFGTKSNKKASSSRDKKTHSENRISRQREEISETDADRDADHLVCLPTKFIFDGDDESKEMQSTDIEQDNAGVDVLTTTAAHNVGVDVLLREDGHSQVSSKNQDGIKQDKMGETTMALQADVVSADQSSRVFARRTRQQSIGSSPSQINGHKRAGSPKSTVDRNHTCTSPQRSPSRGSGFVRRSSRSASVASEPLGGPLENAESPTTPRQLKAAQPPPQDIVFTWTRNIPVRTTNASPRRTSRAFRQGSIRTVDDKSHVSTALAKAFSAGSDSFSKIMEAVDDSSKMPPVDVLSDELQQEYQLLSLELEASRARLMDSRATVLALEDEIKSLEARLERIQKRSQD